MVEHHFRHEPHHPPPDTQYPAAGFSGHVASDMLVQPLVTDLINADIFAALFGRLVAFAPGWGWMWFNGRYWEGGEHKVIELAGQVITARIAAFNQSRYLDLNTVKQVLARLEWFSNAHRLAGMLKVAAGKLCVPATVFDSEPYSLNAGNGVVNLISGELSPHRPEQYNTKWTPVEYYPEAHSALWEKTVSGIACHDVELSRFLQMLAGYSATGDVSAQRLHYFYGAGANGKSLLTGLIAEVLGGFGDTGYAIRLPEETISGGARRTPGSPSPDLLALKGRRLALFSEQDERQPLNPERIKNLTGGDSITARGVNQKSPITFTPSHTLIWCGNHSPYVNAADYGFWRRLLVVPFRASFKPSRLGEELRSPERLAGILSWMVKGAIMLRETGWNSPPCIDEATAHCRKEANPLQQWIAECCTIDNTDTWTTSLYQSYVTWSCHRNEPRMSHSLFTRRMEQLGYAKRVSNGKPLLQGIRLSGA